MLRFLIYSSKFQEIKQKKLTFCLVFRGFLITHSYPTWVTPQSFAKWKVSWKYIILVSFIMIAFWLPSYKVSKFLVPIQHPWNGPFSRVFEPLLYQILPNFAQIIFRGSIQWEKNIVWRIFENFQFYGNDKYPKFALFEIFGYPLKMAEIEKTTYFSKQNLTIGLFQNQGPILSQYDYF